MPRNEERGGLERRQFNSERELDDLSSAFAELSPDDRRVIVRMVERIAQMEAEDGEAAALDALDIIACALELPPGDPD